MPHLRRELLLTIGVPLAVAAVVLVVGVVVLPPPTISVPSRWLSGFGCYDAPLVPVRGSGVSGAAVLCKSATGVRPGIRAQGLKPAADYDVWYLYIDGPSACPAGGCAVGDLIGPDIASTVGRLTARRAGPDGEASFVGLFPNLSPAHNAQLTLLIVGPGADDMTLGLDRSASQVTAAMPEPATATAELAIADSTGTRAWPVVARARFSLP